MVQLISKEELGCISGGVKELGRKSVYGPSIIFRSVDEKNAYLQFLGSPELGYTKENEIENGMTQQDFVADWAHELQKSSMIYAAHGEYDAFKNYCQSHGIGINFEN